MSDAVDVVRRAIEDDQFPGAVVAIGGAEGVSVEAVGALRDGGPPTTPDTVYDLASLSKPLGTLTGVLRLLWDGRLGLDQQVGDHLANAGWFQARSLAAVTIRQLLTHTSGLPAWKPLYAFSSDRSTCIAQVLQTEPGPSGPVVYSDLGFIVLGALIERITRARQDVLVHEVFARLGCGLQYGAGAGPVAPTEDCGWRNRVLVGEVHDENAGRMDGVAGHAGLFGTAEQVATLASAWLREDPALGDPALLREARRCQVDDGTLRRGLGWLMRSKDSFAGEGASDVGFGHTGYTGTSLWIEPDEGWYAVLLTNRVYPTRKRGAKMHAVRRAFYEAVRRERRGG